MSNPTGQRVSFCLALCAASWSCGLNVAGIAGETGDADDRDGIDSAEFEVGHDADEGTSGDVADADHAEGLADGDVPAEDGEDLGETAEDVVVPCTDGLLECLPDGSARRCADGVWHDLGACPLGCDPTSGACYHPSNLPESATVEAGRTELVAPGLAGAGPTILVNGDSGSIAGTGGTVIRNAGTGTIDGIFFDVVPQTGEPSRTVGVFVMDGLDLPAGVTLRGSGTNPIAFLAEHGIHVRGTIDMGAGMSSATPAAAEGHHAPGPGGFPGGAASTAGAGPCGGLADGGTRCGRYCTAGGGGGGFGGRGGDGGDGRDASLSCHTVFEGGDGGGPCGTAELVPLIGGSGGGGGARPDDDPAARAVPGLGGAGGGAFQMTSLESIHIYATGVVTAPGGAGGGADFDGGGGGGGGAGGGLLLEAPTVVLDAGGVLAANGGGGGSGDCT